MCFKPSITTCHDLPKETRNLQSLDAFRSGAEGIVDMPERDSRQLDRLLASRRRKLSTRARENEFFERSPDDVPVIEA